MSETPKNGAETMPPECPKCGHFMRIGLNGCHCPDCDASTHAPAAVDIHVELVGLKGTDSNEVRSHLSYMLTRAERDARAYRAMERVLMEIAEDGCESFTSNLTCEPTYPDEPDWWCYPCRASHALAITTKSDTEVLKGD